MIAFALALALVAQDAAPAARLNSAPDKRVELDFQHYYDVPELGGALEKLAAAYPEFVSVESLGRSAGGRELWLATIGERARGELAARPAIALVSGLSDGDVVGTEMSLYALYDLLQNHARDPKAGELFGRATLYLVPCADPDRRAELFAGRARAEADVTHLERDFPTAWDPFADGAGPYPLSTPETRALVDALLARPNVAQVIATAAGQLAAAARADLPAADREAYARVLAALPASRGALTVLGADRRPRARGSLGEFALVELGAFPFEVRTAAGEGVPPPSEILDLGREHTRVLLELASALPRLSIEAVSLTRQKSDLWQAEFDLVNASALGGTTLLGRERGLQDGIALGLEGGKLLALGTRAGAALDFEPHAATVEPPKLGSLDGGARMRVRLMVQGQAGATLVVRCAGVRYGAVEARATLE